MSISLDAILKDATPDELRDLIVQLAAAGGLPSTSWEPFSVPRVFTELDARAHADLGALIGQIGSSGFLDFAEGPWLDLCTSSFYATTRQPSVLARGNILLVDGAGGGPFTPAAGEVIVRTLDGSLRFTNTADINLPLGGSAPVPFRAESPGGAYNLPEGTEIELVTSLPGVTVALDTPPGGTWITQQGADQETDDALRTRARARWGELGYGATAAAYLYWALTASAEVTRVGIPEPLGDGVVYLYLAGTNGPASGTAVTDVSLYVQQRLPQGVRALVAPAVARTISVAGTAVVKAAYKASAQVAGGAALTKLTARHSIGGIVYRSQIETALMNASPGMIDVQLPGLGATTVLLGNEVPIASVAGLTWVGA